MHPVLILFAHPALQKSRVNRALIEQVQSIPNVTFHDLYEAYPEFDIDVEHEQQLLLNHDVILFQHPFFWYSTPAILKEWQDLVLEHGWAYGSGGNKLHGKMLLSALTTGGSESAYREDGYNRFTIRQLLAPIEQTAHLCGMEYLPPFVAHGTHQMDYTQIEQHANEYREIILALRDNRINWDKARKLPRINSDFKTIMNNAAEETHAR
jgi:glutathione-regulated potassium-efflux system ancillary protein KefG